MLSSSKAEKQLLFLGMIRDYTNTRNYKVLYKKRLRNLTVNRLTVEFLTATDENFKEQLEEKVEDNRFQMLKSIIPEESRGKKEKTYYLVFEKSETPMDSVIMHMKKETNDDTIFVSDVTKKLNDFLVEVGF